MRKSLFAALPADWVAAFFTVLMSCFQAWAEERPRPWLSEVLANPDGVPDEKAEFIEICGAPSQSTQLNGLELHFESQVYRFPSLLLPPAGAFVLCRDSAAATALGIACSGEWSGLQLANARSLWFVLRDYLGHQADYVVPVARAGESLENVAGLNSQGGSGATQLPVFSSSVTPFITGFASPGQCGAAHAVKATPPDSATPSQTLATTLRAESQLDPKTLSKPALIDTRMSLQNPQGFVLAVPTGFAKGEWRLSDRGGRVILTGSLPDKAAVLSLLEGLPGGNGETVQGGGLPAAVARLKLGPYILTLAKGSKRWFAVMSVIP